METRRRKEINGLRFKNQGQLSRETRIKGKSYPQAKGSLVPIITNISTNPLDTLNTLENLQDPANKEDEQQAINMEENKRQEESVQIASQKGASSSPTYVDMTRKKTPEIARSSEDKTSERPLKRVGRKSHKEAREEEVERQKMQGNQATIEMSIDKNTRTKPPKGGVAPTPTSK